jgi:hypothetical protein
MGADAAIERGLDPREFQIKLSVVALSLGGEWNTCGGYRLWLLQALNSGLGGWA